MGRVKTRTEGGFLWPADDRECSGAVLRTVRDVEIAVNQCARRRTVIQAGGNVGVWPTLLLAKFQSVYTFEPDWQNFYCLAHNVVEERCVKINAALGERPGRCSLKRIPRNAGAHSVVEGQGSIHIVTIDSFGLTDVDLIVLDIEGMEERALRGAEDTIRASHPVIHLEDKGLSEAYGTPREHVVEYLTETFGYRVVARPHRDVVLV